MVVLRLVCHGLDSPAHLIILQTTTLAKQLEYLIIRYEIAHFSVRNLAAPEAIKEKAISLLRLPSEQDSED